MFGPCHRRRDQRQPQRKLHTLSKVSSILAAIFTLLPTFAVLAVSVSSRLHAIDDTMRHQLVIDIGPGKLVSASVCLVRSCELVRPSDRSEAEVTDSADSRMESTMDGCVSLLLLGHICNNIVRRRLYNVTVQPSPRWHHQKTTQPAT